MKIEKVVTRGKKFAKPYNYDVKNIFFTFLHTSCDLMLLVCKFHRNLCRCYKANFESRKCVIMCLRTRPRWKNLQLHMGKRKEWGREEKGKERDHRNLLVSNRLL